MNCPGSVWLEKKRNKQMIYRLMGLLNFAFAGAFSTFLPLGGTLHLYRASSLLKGAVSIQLCNNHIQRSKMSATLTRDKVSDLTQSRSWNNHGWLPPSALKKSLCTAHSDFLNTFFFLPSYWMVLWTSCNTCKFDVESQSLWIRCCIRVTVNFCSTCECLPLSLC